MIDVAGRCEDEMLRCQSSPNETFEGRERSLRPARKNRSQIEHERGFGNVTDDRRLTLAQALCNLFAEKFFATESTG